MKMSDVRRATTRRWYLSLAVLVLAGVVAVGLMGSLKGVPQGTATLQVLVDSPVSSLVNLKSNPAGLEARAAVLAQAMASNTALSYMAKAAGVRPNDVTAQGPYSGTAESLDVATPSEARGAQLVAEKPDYRLAFVAQQLIPIVTVSVQAPTEAAAGRFANAVVPGTIAWLDSLAASNPVSSNATVKLRQLGDAQAGTVNSSSGKIFGLAGGVAVLIFGLLGISLLELRRERRRQAAPLEDWIEDEDTAAAAAAVAVAAPAAAAPAAARGGVAATTVSDDRERRVVKVRSSRGRQLGGPATGKQQVKPSLRSLKGGSRADQGPATGDPESSRQAERAARRPSAG